MYFYTTVPLEWASRQCSGIVIVVPGLFQSNETFPALQGSEDPVKFKSSHVGGDLSFHDRAPVLPCHHLWIRHYCQYLQVIQPLSSSRQGDDCLAVLRSRHEPLQQLHMDGWAAGVSSARGKAAAERSGEGCPKSTHQHKPWHIPLNLQGWTFGMETLLLERSSL